MSSGISRERVADLLVDLREDLDREYKSWLDFENNSRDKAIFAKAAIALANHGGGFIVLGFEESDGVLLEAQNRPESLDQYSQDKINGIIQRYCDPPFHCAVTQEKNPDGTIFPIVSVPGGHQVPVCACRGSSDNTVQNNAVYIRKPGPRSEHPNNAQDWNALFARCLRNRRDELLDHVRDLLAGVVPQANPQEEHNRLDQWITTSFECWRTLADSLPDSAEARFQHGYYNFAYEILGEPRKVTLAQLPSILRESVVSHTGWPPFWYPTREGIRPYPENDAVECWLGGDPREEPDVAHSDFWRISPDGFAFLLRGYQEDGTDFWGAGQTEFEPGIIFDMTLPIWRVGETLLHAERLATNLFTGSTTVHFIAKYTGLDGRFLENRDIRNPFGSNQASRQESIELSTHVDTETIGPNLPEIVHSFLSDLYALFGFFELPMQLVTEELARMRRRRSND